MFTNPTLNEYSNPKRSVGSYRSESQSSRRINEPPTVTSRAEFVVKEATGTVQPEKYFTKNVSVIDGSSRSYNLPTNNNNNLTSLSAPNKYNQSAPTAFSEPAKFVEPQSYGISDGYSQPPQFTEISRSIPIRSQSAAIQSKPPTPFPTIEEEIDGFPTLTTSASNENNLADRKDVSSSIAVQAKKPGMDKSSSVLQFNMDNIVRQIRDDIIKRSKKIIEKTTNMKYEDRVAMGYVPEEIREDLEKRLADLMIVGERSGLNKHTLCVYELECHFHIKIAMVHLEGPSESIDKAVQLYRMGQYSEALPMLKHQLEKTNCYMHELIAGCEFNLGKIEEAGFHYQQAVNHMKSRAVTERTVKTEKQQSNLLASAKNAKAKAGESLKNKQYAEAQKYYIMANDLYSAVEMRQDGIDGMVLSMGGMNDVIQALMKLDPVEGGTRDARDALRNILDMHERFSDVVNNCDVDPAFKDHCQALCLNIVGFAFECTGRFASAVSRYRDSMDSYSRILDDRQKIVRMRDCIVKARHAVRALTKQVGGIHPDADVPMQVRQAMSTVLQMHSEFMAVSQQSDVEPVFRAENQAESLNSIGIGYYELRMFAAAEDKLKMGIDLLKSVLGEDCRHITMAQLTYNMGLLKQDIGEMTKAKEYFQEARLQYNRLEDAHTRREGIRKAEEALDEIE